MKKMCVSLLTLLCCFCINTKIKANDNQNCESLGDRCIIKTCTDDNEICNVQNNGILPIDTDRVMIY